MLGTIIGVLAVAYALLIAFRGLYPRILSFAGAGSGGGCGSCGGCPYAAGQNGCKEKVT